MTSGLLTHLPVLQVVIPLLCAPLCTLVRRPTLAWAIAVFASWCSLVIAIALMVTVMREGPLRYALGGWSAPWGIEYRIDLLNAFVLLVVCGIAAVVLPFARASIDREIDRERHPLYYTAVVLNLTGLLGIVVTGDLFNLFVFLEIASLSSYVLVAFSRDPRALLAAFRYLVMGTVGATFILIGIGLLYAATGTLNIADLAMRIDWRSPVDGGPPVSTLRAAFAFLVVGVGLKIAIFPLHGWLPNAYAYAPSAVSAYLSGTGTKVAIYVLIRLLFTLFGVEFAFEEMALGRLATPLALVAIVTMSLVALFQDDLKRLLAYSSLAQIGYMVLGLSLASVNGLTAALVHLFNHALTKSALFLAVACIVYRVGSSKVEAVAGLGRRMPVAVAGFLLASLSLVGVPLTVGFVSKWYLLLAAIDEGAWLSVACVVSASVVALLYTGRVLEIAYFREPAPATVQANAKDAPTGMLVALWLLVAGCLYFGVDTALTVEVAERIAIDLLEARR